LQIAADDPVLLRSLRIKRAQALRVQQRLADGLTTTTTGGCLMLRSLEATR
jgi:hypothetical protein